MPSPSKEKLERILEGIRKQNEKYGFPTKKKTKENKDLFPKESSPS